MVKTLKKFLLLNQKVDDLETCSNGYSSTTIFVKMTAMGWPWPILRQGQIWSILLLYVEKGKTMDFSENIVIYDIMLVDAVNQMSTWSLKNTNGQVHSLTFVQGHSDSTFSNFFSLETPMPIEAKFHEEPPWDGGMKVSTNGLCYMTKMATMSIYGTNL